MYAKTIKVGQAVQIGDAAVVRVDHKSGQMVRLVIATALSPITLIADGIFPARFTAGVTGEMRAIPNEMRAFS